MSVIKLIHIGDVHFPELIQENPIIDQKDHAIDPGLVSGIAASSLSIVTDKLTQTLETETIDGVLFSGDLTSRAEVEKYGECVNYFQKAFDHIENTNNKDIFKAVVPGNHDLHRFGKLSETLESRYSSFKTLLEEAGIEPFDIEGVKSKEITQEQISIAIHSINTCFGCGYFYNKYPEEIKLYVEQELKREKTPDRFKLVGERLDTPAIRKKDVDELKTLINASSEYLLNVVLGHHPLISQALVRMEIYTELVNSGYVRTVLSQLKHPVIYCHGHIHEDPIECVKSLKCNHANSGLFLISAPEFSKGFNIVEIHFSTKSVPIGVMVREIRVTSYGAIEERIHKIPLRSPTSAIGLCSEKIQDVYANIPSDPTRVRDLKILASEIKLKSALLELEWLQLIKIQSKDAQFDVWIIEKVGI